LNLEKRILTTRFSAVNNTPETGVLGQAVSACICGDKVHEL